MHTKIDRKLPAKKAKSAFYSEFNDIDIYVEDSASGYRKIYRELLRRVFKDDYKIEEVFPLGERESVIDACRSVQSKSFSRKQLYIVDGDFYLMHTPDEDELKGLFVLPRYCIENFLIDEDALAQVFFEIHPDDELKQMKDKMNFSAWITSNENDLFNLFIEYAVANFIEPQIQTVGYSITKLCSSNKGIVDPIKVHQRIDYIRNILITNHGATKYEKIRNDILNNVKSESEKLLKYVSGKNYLLPMIFLRGCTLCGVGCDNIRFKLRLAMLADVKPLLEMKYNLLG